MRTLLEMGASFVALGQVGASVGSHRALNELSSGLRVDDALLISTLRFGATAFDATDAAFAHLTEWQAGR